MSEKTDVNGQEVVQPEGSVAGTATQNQEPDWVKERISVLSAQKNAAKQEAEDLRAQLARLEARLNVAEAYDRPNQRLIDSGELDPNQQWVQDYMAPQVDPLKQDVAELKQMFMTTQDKADAAEFWADPVRAGQPAEFRQMVENMVARALQDGQKLNREFAYKFVLGEVEDVARREAASRAAETRAHQEQVNQAARVVSGAQTTSLPAKQKTFEDLSPKEKFQELKSSGALADFFKPDPTGGPFE